MNERTKEEERKRPCCEIRLQSTKCTVWPRNVLTNFLQHEAQVDLGSSRSVIQVVSPAISNATQRSVH